MRFNSFLTVIVFAVAFAAAGIAFVRWSVVFSRAAAAEQRSGNHVRADLLRQRVRQMLLWGAGTVLFTAVFWLAVCHDLDHPGSRTPALPSGRLLP